MRNVLVALALVAFGCGSQATQTARHTLPEPETSPLPDEVERPTGGVQTTPVAQCRVSDAEDSPVTGPGILFSDETALYVGRLRVAYDEVRGLYRIDHRTWERMQGVYRHHLELADDEIARANERAERSWWEQNDGVIGFFGGVLLGAAVVIGIAAALDAALGADASTGSP